MTIFRAFRYKIYPTIEQDQLLRQAAGVCRLIYNLALEQRATWGRRRHITSRSQNKELTSLRTEFDWIRAVCAACQQEAIRDVDQAFSWFFSGKTGFPKPRKKGASDSFRVPGCKVAIAPLNGKWMAIRLPNIGWLKVRAPRHTTGEVRTATVSLDASGLHISLVCKIEHEAPPPRTEIVGLDRGVATTLALSTGETWTLPATLDQIEQKKRKAQTIVCRRKPGSKRRARAQRKVSRLQAKQVRIRRDFHHKAALNISRRFGVAAIEGLNTRRMTGSARGTVAAPGRNVRQKAGMNRAILNAGWYEFSRILTYKMEERGGQVATVPAQFTSQTCSACGVVDARSRESQARFKCVSCGHTDHADINAAVNIKRRWSTPSLDVEGSGAGRPMKRQLAGDLSPPIAGSARRGC